MREMIENYFVCKKIENSSLAHTHFLICSFSLIRVFFYLFAEKSHGKRKRKLREVKSFLLWRHSWLHSTVNTTNDDDDALNTTTDDDDFNVKFTQQPLGSLNINIFYNTQFTHGFLCVSVREFFMHTLYVFIMIFLTLLNHYF